MVLGWMVVRKMIRIAKAYRITSIADFIASRYGKSPLLAGLVTLITVVGIVPYRPAAQGGVGGLHAADDTRGRGAGDGQRLVAGQHAVCGLATGGFHDAVRHPASGQDRAA